MRQIPIIIGLSAVFCGVQLFPGPLEDDHGLLPVIQIVGGEPAVIQSYNFMAALFLAGSLCGGSLYNSSFIITAAHCVYGKSKTSIANFSVLLNSTTLKGSPGHKLVAVKNFTIHPSYNARTKDNDVAILSLRAFVPFPSVTLPALNSTESYVGKNALVLGWGTTSQGGNISNTLLQAAVTVWNNTACAKTYSGINALKVCAAAQGKDTCQGDSGGPLLVDGVLVGITSYGHGCANLDYPGVYARVTALNSWIRTTINSKLSF